MRRLTYLLIAMFVLAAFPAAAQKILPRSLGQWTGASNIAEPMRPAALTGVMPVAPQAILTEYGWISTESLVYTSSAAGGANKVQATVFKLKDPSDGYGLYSYLLTPDMARADFTEHSSMSHDRALVLAGNLVLDVEGQDLGKSETQLKALVAALRAHAQTGPLPSLGELLPQSGMVPRTNRYILGPQALNAFLPVAQTDWLGFSKGAEAELAHYNLKGHDATLLIADYPTPQLAAQELGELEKNYNVNGSSQTPGATPLFAKRSLTLIAIVSGAPTQTDADTLLRQVHSGTELTWDEPTFQFKEPSIEMMIVGTIIGAGTICLFALIAGVSFGGLRLVVKRLWPGKIFDRHEHLQVLQLGLGSKPINSDDFYGYSAPAAGGSPVDKNLPDRVALRIFR